MSVRSEVLLWAQRIIARGSGTPAHVLLDVKSDASFEEAQDAFHKIARTGHPDLHRASLTPEELELVTHWRRYLEAPMGYLRHVVDAS